MSSKRLTDPGARSPWLSWAVVGPIAALGVLAYGLLSGSGPLVFALAGVALVVTIPAAVHHAEAAAHRAGQPLGALILAVAVTVIEVGLIVTLMASGKPEAATLARDTVFAAVMLTTNGIVGLSLLVCVLPRGRARFNPSGTATALSTVLVLSVVGLVLPSFTTSQPGAVYSPPQLAFAAAACLLMYATYVVVLTVRHPEDFATDVGDAEPSDPVGEETSEDAGDADGPSVPVIRSVMLLTLALVAVVGLAKLESPAIESLVDAVGAPESAVGVVIAAAVLMPEVVTAWRNARRGRTQTALNLAYGSAIASIGLTIPAIAVASVWIGGPLELGLGPTQLVLLATTGIVSALTVLPGRATLQQACLHLVLAAVFLFVAFVP